MALVTSTRLSDVLRPLDLLDLPRAYQQHALVIDFVIYLMLFNGLAQVAYRKRFEGKGGRLVAAAVGSSLALAMMGVEAATGFTLSSLGSIAAAILLLLVGMTIYRALRHAGAAATTAGAVGIILLGLGIKAAAPRLSDSLFQAFPFIDLMVLASLVVLVWRGIAHMSPAGASRRLGELAADLENGKPEPNPRPGTPKGEEIGRLRQELRREKPEIGHHLKVITKQERKPCRQILKELAVVRSTLERKGTGLAARKEIADALRRIAPQRHELAIAVERVKALDRGLARFDMGVLQELRQAWDRLPEAERPLLRKLALEERRKLRSERRIAELENFITSYDGQAAATLDRAARAILANDAATALTSVKEAEKLEGKAAAMVREILGIERELRRIMRLELRQTRQAA